MQTEFDTPFFQIVIQFLITWPQSNFYQTLTSLYVQKGQVQTLQHSSVSSSLLATSNFFIQTILYSGLNIKIYLWYLTPIHLVSQLLVRSLLFSFCLLWKK